MENLTITEKELMSVLEEKNFMKHAILDNLGLTKEEIFEKERRFIEGTLEYPIYRKSHDTLKKSDPDTFKKIFTKESRFERFSIAYDNALADLSLEKVKWDGTLKLTLKDDWMQDLVQKGHSAYKITQERKAMNELALNVLDKSVEEMTVLDKLILKNYTGKGGIGEEGVEILTQYFTDYKTINFIWEKLKSLNFPLSGITALEPSCGIGSFIGLSPQGIKWDAIDIDATLIEMVKRLYPNVNAMNKSFEDHSKNDHYDLVVTNVPFANSRGMGLVKDKPDIRKLHDYFILASIDKLKPNGMAALIVPSSFMDSANSKIREMVSSKAELVSSFRLPDEVFIKTGADVITDILFFRKRVPGSDESKEFENNKNFLEIDFPEKFQKPSRQLSLNKYYSVNKDHVLGNMVEYKNRYGQYVIKVIGNLSNDVIDKAISINELYTPAAIENKAEDKPKEKTLNELLKGINMEEEAPIDGIFKLLETETDEDTSTKGDDSLSLMEKALKKMENTSWYRRSLKKVKGFVQETAIPISVSPGAERKIEAILEIANIALSMREYAREGDTYAVRQIVGELKAKVDEFKKNFAFVFENQELKKVMEKDPRYSIVKVLCNNPDIFKTDTVTRREYHIPLKDNKSIKEVCQYLILKENKITINNFASVFDGGITKDEAERILTSSDEVFKLPSMQERQHYNKGEILTVIEKQEPTYERAIDYLSGNIYKKLEFAQREVDKGNIEYQKNLDALNKVLPKPRTLNDVRLSVRHKWIDLSVIETFIRQYLGFRGFNVLFDDIKGEFNVNFAEYNTTNHEMKKKLDIGYAFPSWIEKYLNAKEIIVRDSDGLKDVVASAKVTERMKIVDELFSSYLKKNPEISEPLMKRYNYIFNNTKIKDYSEDMVIPEVGEGWKFRKNQIEVANMLLSLGSGINSHRVGGGKTAASALVSHMLKVYGRSRKPMSIVPQKVIKKFVRDILKGTKTLPAVFPNMKILDATEYEFNEALAMIAYNEWDMILIPDTWFKRIAMTPKREMAYIEKQIWDLKISESHRAAEKGVNRQQKDFENRLQNLEARLAELRNYVRRDGLYFEDLGVDAISLDEAQSVKNLVASVKGSELGLSATPSQIAMDFNMKAQYIMEITNGNNVFLYTATPVSNSILEIYGLFLNIAPYEWESRYIYTADDFIDFFADTSVTYGITKENEVGVVRKVDGFINLDDLRALFRKYVDYRVSIDNMDLPESQETRIITDMTLEQRLFFNSLLERLKDIPADKSEDNVLRILIEGRQGSISESLFTGNMPTRDNSPKIAKAIEMTYKIYKEIGGNQLIFLDQYGKSVLGNNDLHTFIKNELIKEGIPANEIVICNGTENSSRERKLEIQDMFNDGTYRILIGTCISMGAGMDLQEQTVATHNIDIPWTPTAVEQKSGRMNRPGNKFNTVLTLNYYVRGSYDSWSASIVAIKKKWQEQLLLGGMDSVNGYTKNKDDDSWSMETIMAEIMEDQKEKAIMNFKAKSRKILSEKVSLEERILKHTQSIDDLMKEVEDREEKIKAYQDDLNKGIKVKLANMRIKQLSETVNKLMEEANQLTTEKESFEIQLKNVSEELKTHEEGYEEIIDKADKMPAAKKIVVDLDEIVSKLKEANKDVELPAQTNSFDFEFTSIVTSTNSNNENKEPIFNMFSVNELVTKKKTFKSKEKTVEQFTMNLDALM